MDSIQSIDNLLGLVQTAPPPNAGRLIVAYGPTGIGKTTTFCQAKDVLLIECGDYSSGALKDSGGLRPDLPTIALDSFDRVLETINTLATNEHPYRNIVIDGGSGLKKWTDQLTLSSECGNEKAKFASYGFGERSAAFYWAELMEALVALKNSGAWIFLICHDAIVNKKNASGADYIKNSPDLGKDRLAMTIKEADAILFMDFIVAEHHVDAKTFKGKASGGEMRVMYTQPSASYEAKNRLNLQPIIQLGKSPQESFSSFVAAVKAGKKGKQ